MLLLGNLLSLVGCSMMIIIGFIKKKEKIMLAQFTQFCVQSVSNLVLGSVSGFIAGVIAAIRIFVFTNFKVTVWMKLAVLALQAALTMAFGAQTIIEWIPFLSMILYTWYLDTDNVILFKLVNIFGVMMWAFHDFHYSNYVAFSFDVMTTVSTIIGILMVLREKKKSEQADSDI